jgi:hypothetical protein
MKNGGKRMQWKWYKAVSTTLTMIAVIGAVATSASAAMSYDSKGRFVMDGKPRFVLGVYDSGLSYSTDPAFYENALFSSSANRLYDLPINLYLNYHYGQSPMSAMNPLMDVLHNHGVKYLQTANCFDTGSYKRIAFSLDQSDSYPQQFSVNTGAAGYYIMDECVDSLIAETKAHHDKLKSLTPNVLTLAVTLARGYIDPNKWVGAADVIGTDPYPLFGAEPAAGYTHFQVADFVAQAAQAAGPAKPSMSVLQFFKFTSDSRFPTPGEYRSHAVMSVVEGAKGIMWWEIGSNGLRQADAATVTTQMGYLRTLVKELASLEPVLIADDVDGALVGNSTKFSDPIAGRKQQLQYDIQVEWLYSNKDYYQAELNRLNAGDTSRSPMLDGAATIRTKTKVVNGKGYVFAYNYTNKSTPVTFTWQNAPGTVTENKTGQAYPVSGSSWSDTFGPYQARIYVVSNGGGTTTTPTPTPTPTSPVVSFTNPASNATVSATTTVTMAASGGSGSGYSYKLAVDGTTVYTGTNPSVSWNTTNTANGTRTLTATVTDSAGKSGTATRTVTVSNTAPVTSFTASFTYPAAGASVAGVQSVGMATTAVWGQSKTFTLLVDGTKTITSQTLTGTTLWSTWDTTTLSNGAHTLTLKVTQNGATATATRSVMVANAGATTPPPTPALLVGFVALASGATVSGTTNLSFVATGGSGTGYTFLLKVDSTTLSTGAATSYSWNTTGTANGSHTLSVTATDSKGTKATATRTVTVSNTVATPSPTASFTASFSYPAAGAIVSGGHTVGMATTATWGQAKTFTLLVDNTVITSQSLTGTTLWITWDTTKTGNGSHTLTLKVKDATGVTATATRLVTVGN